MTPINPKTTTPDVSVVIQPDPSYVSVIYTADEKGVKLNTLTTKQVKAFETRMTKLAVSERLQIEKENRSNQIRRQFDLIIRKYSEFEEQSFTIQYTEYVNYTKDPLSPTPYCDELVKVRGITKKQLMTNIDKHIKELANTHAIISKKLDDVWASTTTDELNAIVDSTYHTLP